MVTRCTPGYLYGGISTIVAACLILSSSAPSAAIAQSNLTPCSVGQSLCVAGLNADGELGNGTLVNSDAFGGVAYNISSPLQSLAAGIDHSLAVLADGTVLAWGRNNVGQLGNGSTMSSSTPIPVSGLGAGSGVIAVAAAASGQDSLALKADGNVLAWGDNAAGELGTGDFTNRLTPTLVVGLPQGSPVVAIASGAQSLALMADGAVWAWGALDRTSTPAQVPGLGPGSGVTGIASGGGSSMAIKKDGSVWAWGLGAFGKLGNGSTQSSGTPVNVSGLRSGSGAVAIADGQNHAMALKADGSVVAWGDGAAGQLGTGSTAGSLVPVQVSGLGPGSGVVKIAAGGGDSFAISNTSVVGTSNAPTLLAWGDDSYGELGDGTNHGYVLQPEAVSGVTAPLNTTIAAGYFHTLVAPVSSQAVNASLEYVALGDSYSSGEGNPPFINSKVARACHRSEKAWPYLLARRFPQRIMLAANLACSGAKASNALVKSYQGQQPQLYEMNSLRPTLVTITIGGNDIGFTPVLRYCYYASDFLRRPGLCINALKNEVSIISAFGDIASGYYNAIETEAPRSAQIVVVGYPRLFPQDQRLVVGCWWLTSGIRMRFNALTAELDRKLAAAAYGIGAANVSYASTLNVLNGHELCTTDSWVNRIVTKPKHTEYEGHPNLPGQEAIADAVRRHLGF